jgi:hypothetical protein
VDAKFVIDVAKMYLNGLVAEEQAGGHLLIGEAGSAITSQNGRLREPYPAEQHRDPLCVTG